nr:putative ribonuclease h protein [Quercus suber]
MSRPNCSDPKRRGLLWKGIWSLQVPHKIKHLLWKAANEAIPTLYNLWRRQVVFSVLCPGCKSACEDTTHALWACPALISVWESDGAMKNLLKYKVSMFADLLELIFSTHGGSVADLFAVMFWLIWEKRNNDRMKERSCTYQNIRPSALQLLHDFSTAQDPKNSQLPLVPAGRVRWIPPISPGYKVNYDGAIFKDIGAAGLGVVIRDAGGSVIGSLMERIPLPLAVASVEALACRRAVLFAKELCIFDASFEGDSEIVTNALRRGESNHPEFGLVILDALELARGFRSCNFVHVNRLGNSVAHFLARSSKSGNELQVWMESVPGDIAPLVSRDVL